MRFRSLEILDKMRFVFEGVGVNYPVMRRLLELKLTMDSRRIPTVLQNNKSKDDGDGNKMLKSLWMYALLSMVPGVMTILDISLFSKVTFTMGISMFLIMTTMVSDFSSVLLDMRDKSIIMTLPVSSRTLAAAKTVHIAIYLTLITVSMNILPLAGITFNHGVLNALLYLVMLIFMVLMVIFLTSLIYVLILKNFDGERLKDLISGIQIMLTIIVSIGYQLVGRVFDLVDVSLEFQPTWWTYLMPPAWLAGPFGLLNGETGTAYIVLSVLGILMPVLFITLHIRVISPAFEQYLSKLNSSGEKPSGAYFRRLKMRELLSGALTGNPLEKASMKFGYSVLSSERELKQKVYPSMALSMLFPFILALPFLDNTDSLGNALSEIRETNMYLMVYASVLLLPSLMNFISRSQHYKGAWIYRTLPMESPKQLISGAYKGALIRYGLVPYVFTSAIMLLVFGARIVPHLAIAYLNSVYLTLILMRSVGLELPFGSGFQVTEDGQVGKTMVGMFGALILGGLHYLLVKYANMPVVMGVMGLQILGLLPLWRSTLDVSWSDMKAY